MTFSMGLWLSVDVFLRCDKYYLGLNMPHDQGIVDSRCMQEIMWIFIVQWEELWV